MEDSQLIIARSMRPKNTVDKSIKRTFDTIDKKVTKIENSVNNFKQKHKGNMEEFEKTIFSKFYDLAEQIEGLKKEFADLKKVKK